VTEEVRVRTRPRVLVVLLASAALLMAAANASGGASSAAGPGERRVTARGRGGHGSFTPAVLRVTVGETVEWVAAEGDHTVVSDGGAFQSDAFAADYEPHSYSYTFSRPGRYTYHCSLAQMTGVIEVTDPSGATTTTEPSTTTTTRELYRKPSAAPAGR
jgi:plastocyanin